MVLRKYTWLSYGTLITFRSPDIFAPAKIPVEAGKNIANTEKNVSPSLKSGAKFSKKGILEVANNIKYIISTICNCCSRSFIRMIQSPAIMLMMTTGANVIHVVVVLSMNTLHAHIQETRVFNRYPRNKFQQMSICTYCCIAPHSLPAFVSRWGVSKPQQRS